MSETPQSSGMATALHLAQAASAPAVDLLGAPLAAPPPAPSDGKGGRPPGAHNRRTERYAGMLLALHGDPLAQAVKVAAVDVMEPGAVGRLAELWGVANAVALAFIRDSRTTVLPYLHQQQPRAVELHKGAPGNPIAAVEVFAGALLDLMPDAAE